MRLPWKTKCTPLFVGLPMVAGLLLAIFATPLTAQPVRTTHLQRGFVPGYDATREVTVSGTVQQVITKRTLGSPAGMHLLVSGAEEMVDVHVGQFLTKDTRQALHMGLPIQIVGSMQTLHGKQYLMARQMNFGGRTITVRSKTGFLVGAPNSRRTTSRRALKIASSSANGGAR